MRRWDECDVCQEREDLDKTRTVSGLKSCIMTLELLLDPQVNLTRHPESTPVIQLCDSESQAQFSVKKKKGNASDDLHEVTLGHLLTTHSEESITSIGNWNISAMVYIISSVRGVCVLL